MQTVLRRQGIGFSGSNVSATFEADLTGVVIGGEAVVAGELLKS